MSSPEQIHPHMPVILPEQHHAAWLAETENGNLTEFSQLSVKKGDFSG
jgi:hypothetical protein